MDIAHSPPPPGADEQAHSDKLAKLIRDEIAAAGGGIPFARYMELCLYAPGLGYYSAGLRKFGAGGDFVTAPELSPLFGRSIARTCAAVLQDTGGDILEFGAGSGRLAVDLLRELESLDCLPGRYLVLERSAELRQRQQLLLQRELPGLFPRVIWLDRLPAQPLEGVLLGNEVLDAMAVERFRWDGVQAQQYCVGAGESGFRWQLQTPDDAALVALMADIAHECELAPAYVSEVNAGLRPWLRGAAGCLRRGLLLLIDYGYPRSEYYHPQRSSGTLLCHYRQHAHDDPLILPGLQDITAHVDFTAVAEAAVAAGLSVSGYTTQAHFLLDCGIDGLLTDAGPGGGVDYLRLAQQAKTLMLPGEMGERFQCIGLTRDLDIDIPGFQGQDLRYRL
jgi:SAM-dependent MidA family methyltransferase